MKIENLGKSEIRFKLDDSVIIYLDAGCTYYGSEQNSSWRIEQPINPHEKELRELRSAVLRLDTERIGLVKTIDAERKIAECLIAELDRMRRQPTNKPIPFNLDLFKQGWIAVSKGGLEATYLGKDFYDNQYFRWSADQLCSQCRNSDFPHIFTSMKVPTK